MVQADLIDVFRRLALEIGAASGYVVPSSRHQQMDWRMPRDRRLQSSLFTDPRPLPLLHVSDLCMFGISKAKKHGNSYDS